MKLIAGMDYRQWQRRNTERFNSLTKSQQKTVRCQGYNNVGWDKVQNSWTILRLTDIPSLFEYKLRNGDITGAINLSILEAERAKKLALETIDTLNKNQKYFDQLADGALAKYPLL